MSTKVAKRTRRKFTAAFKAKVALAALREDKAINQLAVQLELDPNQISDWRTQLVERAGDVFDGTVSSSGEAPPVDLNVLHAKIGQLALENDFLAGALNKAGLLSDAK